MVKLLYLLILLIPTFVIGQTQNFWTKKNDFGGLKRERAIAFSIGSYGYIGTGVNTAEMVLKDLWQYDPTNDSWTQKADLPGSKRRDAVAFTIGEKAYVGTGIDSDASYLGTKLKDFWEYNPTSNSWMQIADYPGGNGNGIYFSTGFSIDSKGYVCCGKIGPNFYSNQLWEYKPSINQWTQRANFPGGIRYQLSSFTIGYNGYVGLGADKDVYRKDFWKYNPGSNEWTQIADLPASERGCATTFTIGERGFVCLGVDGGFLDDLWEYNPYSDQWSVRASYGGSERKNAVAFVLNNKAYVGTGKGYSGKKESMQEYTPYETLGINDLIEQELVIYPNPAKDNFTIKIDDNRISYFELYSFEGKKVQDIEWKNMSQQTINCTNIESGVYLLIAFDESHSPLNKKQIILY